MIRKITFNVYCNENILMSILVQNNVTISHKCDRISRNIMLLSMAWFTAFHHFSRVELIRKRLALGCWKQYLLKYLDLPYEQVVQTRNIRHNAV